MRTPGSYGGPGGNLSLGKSVEVRRGLSRPARAGEPPVSALAGSAPRPPGPLLGNVSYQVER